jgi:Mg2+-importing ATPase
MSVVVDQEHDHHRLICKGAVEEILAVCTLARDEDRVMDLTPERREVAREVVHELNEDGFRVVAVAYRDFPRNHGAYAVADEATLVLAGFVSFLDPPKETAAPALKALAEYGVAVKILTGDNDLVSRKVCRDVGLQVDHMVLGSDLVGLDDAALGEVADQGVVFAKLTPDDKVRIVRALRARGHTVGFMGDGINDAGALREADVGISVDSAVDIAKESADIILLEKSLMVLEEGVLEGRKVFVNILKYIRMGASSNFGNMFSVIGASAWLPYVPMAPLQVLTNNLLYDFSQVPIPTDNVGADQIGRPRPWHMGMLAKFILFIGPISSIFDYTTYAMMWFVFQCNRLTLVPPPELAARFAGATDPNQTYAAALFHTGWFVESLMTQTLVIHVIRTNRMPFVQSWASWQLTVTTVLVMALGAWLPQSPVGEALGFVPLPGLYWPLLALTLVCYLVLTQIVKTWLLRRSWV